MNRAAFMSIANALYSQPQVAQVEMAYLLSKKFHSGQTRKEIDPATGLPARYFVHPRRVALIVMDELGHPNHLLPCAGLLHDTIEDAEETLLITRLIDQVFGPHLSAIIRALTKVPKAGYIDRLRDGPPEALIVKAADRLDNLRTLPADNVAFCAKQRRETIDVYLPLFNQAQVPAQLINGITALL